MVMRIRYTPHFKRAFAKLSREEKAIAVQKLELFAGNPRHPSLQSKKIKGSNDVWESRVNRDIRFTWQYCEDGVRLRVTGHHDEALTAP